MGCGGSAQKYQPQPPQVNTVSHCGSRQENTAHTAETNAGEDDFAQAHLLDEALQRALTCVSSPDVKAQGKEAALNALIGATLGGAVAGAVGQHRREEDAIQKVVSLMKDNKEDVDTVKATPCAADDFINRQTKRAFEAADILAAAEDCKEVAEELRRNVEFIQKDGMMEVRAMKETVPLKEKLAPAVDETTVKGMSPVHELPGELAWLQRHQGDEELIECSHCQGTGLADQGASASLARCATKRDLGGQLEKALGRRGASVSALLAKMSVEGQDLQEGPDVLWLYETNGGGWTVFDAAAIADLEAAREEGEGAVLRIMVRNQAYEVDVKGMTQTNIATGAVRRIRRVNNKEPGSGNPVDSLKVKRRSCRRFPGCPQSAEHWQCLAHPGDWDYVEPDEAAATVAYSWFVQSMEEVGWAPIDEGMAAYLEVTSKLPQKPAGITLRLPPGGDHRIDIAQMQCVEVKTGRKLNMKRYCEDDAEPEAVQTNMVPEAEEPVIEEPEPEKCWVCAGSGKMSKWLDAKVVAEAHSKRESGDFGDYDCCVCYGEGQYALSSECGEHFFCSDCIVGSLEAMLESAQFPPFCPMCRAYAMGGELVKGRVGDPELSFLQQRGVIDRDFLFRFLKQAHQYDEVPRDDLKYFACPSKCGRFLLEKDESYEKQQLGEYFGCGPPRIPAMRMGVCPCGQFICIKCQGAERYAFAHKCTDSAGPQMIIDEATLKYLATIGKKCPACNMVIQKNDGCHIMMCGTQAHGKVKDALRNGGCAYIFNWNDLKMIPADTYEDIHGNRAHRPPPITEFQVNFAPLPDRETW